MYRVLVVEDNAPDLAGIVKHTPWEELDCKVVATAVTGRDGLLKTQQFEPDIIITDISMPEMSGIEMTEEVLKKRPDIQIIFISCFDDFNFAKYAVDYNVSSYILKPIKIKELTEAIKKSKKSLDEAKKRTKKERELTKLMSENRTIIKEKFLINLLIDKTNDTKYIKSQSNFCGIDPDSRYHFIIMQLPAASSRESIQDLYSLQFYLKNICSSHFKSIPGCHLTTYGVNSVFMIADVSQLSSDDLIGRLQSIQSEYAEKAMSGLYMYVSKSAFPLNELHQAFEVMYKAITDGIYDTKKQILIMDEDIPQQEINISQSDNIFKKLSDILLSGENIENLLSEYFKDVSVIGIESAKALCFYIISSLNIILKERNVTFKDIFGEQLDVWHKISRISSIGDVYSVTTEILEGCHKFFAELSENYTENKAELIMASISQNFAHPDAITIALSGLGISLNYANILFKKRYKVTIFEHLVFLRIAQAKKLLADKRLMVHEIAEMVGYSSKAYFSTVFKQHTGLTPKEYRMSVLAGKIDERND